MIEGYQNALYKKEISDQQICIINHISRMGRTCCIRRDPGSAYHRSDALTYAFQSEPKSFTARQRDGWSESGRNAYRLYEPCGTD